MAGGFMSPYSGSSATPFAMGQPSAAPPANNSLTTQYNLYNQGVKQNAEDYSGIMQGYKDLYSKALSMPQLSAPSPITPQKYTAQSVGAGQITPQDYRYNQSSQSAASLGELARLTASGGYSDQDITDLRARGISPIRAVYANAQRNIDRQRALQGGYSPNYTAATAKMSRELADEIANATQNVNAGIAQNVASNKIAIAPSYASAAGAENALSNQYGRMNIDARNRAQEQNVGNALQADIFNAGGANQANQFNIGQTYDANKFNAMLPIQYGQYNQGNADLALRALGGQTSLYGTTPALSATFGNQALQGAQLQNQIKNQGLGAQVQLANNYGYR